MYNLNQQIPTCKMATNGDMGDDKDDLKAIVITDGKMKKDFLLQLSNKHKELGKRQREYKKVLSIPYKSRNDTIIAKGFKNATERLRVERNDLRAQVWVANGAPYVRENNLVLAQIKCHVKCQEELSSRIRTLKTDISNLERGIQIMRKEIYELNRKTVPDTQHQAHVASTRTKLNILENRLEVGIRQESIFTAMNAAMLYKINNILFERKYFYDTYSKMMQTLNSDKKYLQQLMESAYNIFENCTDASEKIDIVIRKNNKENDVRKFETQTIMRNKAASQEAESFILTKSKYRNLAPLQPKELRRREEFLHSCRHNIDLYNNVLNKLLAYAQVNDFSEVIDRYQQQESLYYSYFTMSNEVGYHVTLLANSTDRLFSEVEKMRGNVKQNSLERKSTIDQLNAELAEKKQRNADLAAEIEAKSESLSALFANMNAIVRACNLNLSPLLELLGDNKQVNLNNVSRFTKLLEKRVINIVATVYCQERADQTKPRDNYVIKSIEKIIDIPTDIRNVVLTQQCPECAEGEVSNMDDFNVRVLTLDEVRRKLYDKVKQPEMQYRLHNISQCRLPRSRILTAKRNA